MDIPRNSKSHVDPSIRIGRSDGIDEDGHYDETRDFTLMKRLKKDFPEAYDELMKNLEPFYQNKESN